jgi:hypothetical protein
VNVCQCLSVCAAMDWGSRYIPFTGAGGIKNSWVRCGSKEGKQRLDRCNSKEAEKERRINGPNATT